MSNHSSKPDTSLEIQSSNIIMAGGEAKLQHPNAPSIQVPRAASHINTATEMTLVFTLFPKLPTEIRLKIWKLTLPGPRFIEIRSDGIHLIENDKRTGNFVWFPACIENAPSIFWACHEARAEACKSYIPLRGNADTPVVFCDFNKDYMCITYPRFQDSVTDFFAEMMFEEMRNLVRNIIIDEFSFEYLETEEARGNYKFTQLLHLEELALVPREYSLDCSVDGIRITGFKELVGKSALTLEILVDSQFIKWKSENRGWKPPLLRIGEVELAE